MYPSQSRARFIAGGSAFAAAALLAPSALRAADAAVLNVGDFAIDPMAVGYYAQDLGYFQKRGLNVNLQAFPGGMGPGMPAAVAAGSLQIGMMDPCSLSAAHLHGLDFKMIAAGAISTPETATDPIMVLRDSPITKAADLNGKTVGTIVLKSLQQVAGMAWVDKNGGDSKTLKFVELAFPEMQAALEQKRVDAVLLTEPFATAAKAKARPLGDILQGVADRFVVMAYFAGGAWLEAHPAEAAKFVAAIEQAAVWANANQNASGKILTKYSKMPPPLVAAMSRTTYGTSLTAALVQPVIDASARYGVIPHAYPAADLIWHAPSV